MIDQMKQDYPVRAVCEALDCPPSTYYYRSQAASDDDLITAIEDVLMRRPFYGYRRVIKQLQRQGWPVGETRVRRVLKVMGHTVKVGRVRVRTTDSSYPHWRYPNLLKRLKPKYPNHVWVADITYLRLGWRFIYLAVILDGFSRKVVGWALDKTLATRLPLSALHQAIAGRQPLPGVVHHSDRGIQYASGAYVQLLRQHQMIPSMSRPANPYDNASCESFLKTLKREEIYANTYRDLEHLRMNMAAFIDQYYNRIRLHSALGYRPPEEFEQAMTSGITPGAAALQFFRPTEGFSSEERSEEAERETRKTPVC